jgi:hypothetical protein
MKPLTPKMIEVLMDCHEKELLKHEPCGSYNTRYAKGLITRGFFEPLMYSSKVNGKKYMAFIVSKAGREYLAQYTSK